MELENFYALISMETPALSGINISDVFFMINGNKIVLNPENLKKTLKDVGISNNDLIYVGVSRAPAPTQRLPATPGTSTGSTDASQLISQLVKSIKVPPKATKKPANAEFNPNTLASSPDFRKQVKQMFLALDNRITQIRLKDQHPRAVEQYLKDPKDFEAFLNAIIEDRKDFFRRLQLTADPTSPEGQALIAEFIRQEVNKKQFEQAMKDMPETFIHSHMLYIKLKINGVDTIGFVDSGAQVTTISRSHAEKFGLTHKIDNSFATIIRGVGGEQVSEGRIHSAELEMNGHIIKAPMTVLDRFGEDILIGLDTMRRHRAVIDLSKNCIRFGEVEVPFLNEKEYVDECRRLDLKINLPPDYLEPLKPEDVDSSKVAHLVEMGYETEEASNALAKCQNDLASAVQMIETQRQESTAEAARHASEKSEPMEQN